MAAIWREIWIIPGAELDQSNNTFVNNSEGNINET